MDGLSYSSVLYLAAGAFLLAAVLAVWRRELRAIVRLLAWQGVALAALPIVEGIHAHDGTLVAVGVAVLGLRAVLLPGLLNRAVMAVGVGSSERRESSPLVNTTASLLIVAALTVTAFAISDPLVNVAPTETTRALPAAIAVILIGGFVMASRRQAVSQAVGFLMVDNGIAATSFLVTAGVPLVVELGVSLDVLFAVLVLGVLTSRIRQAFGATDLDQLRELHD